MPDAKNYFLQPGYIFASLEPHLVHTVLGSCVAVCLWDSRNRFGGMNHYLLPRNKQHESSAKYGNVSVPYLISLMKEYGAHSEDLRAHILGGSRHIDLNSYIGDENVAVAEELLHKYKIEIVTKDVGGQIGRKVIFNTENGEILVYKVNKIRESDWYRG